jgi:hypothetical protein
MKSYMSKNEYSLGGYPSFVVKNRDRMSSWKLWATMSKRIFISLATYNYVMLARFIFVCVYIYIPVSLKPLCPSPSPRYTMMVD